MSNDLQSNHAEIKKLIYDLHKGQKEIIDVMREIESNIIDEIQSSTGIYKFPTMWLLEIRDWIL